MNVKVLVDHVIRWPIPADKREWPLVVLQLVNPQPPQDYSPARRHNWLLYRVVAAELAHCKLPNVADDFEIEQAATDGTERIRAGEVPRKVLCLAFHVAMEGCMQSNAADTIPKREVPKHD